MPAQFSAPGIDARQGGGSACAMVVHDQAGHAEANFRRGYELAKRVLDLVLATLALVVLLPVILVALIAIRLESPGPALFRQRRLGRHGKPFHLLKMRGMYVDAAERFPEMYDYGSRSEGEDFFFHEADDPRVTRVGRWLRARSLDELPNLWNVLRGDISLVGPRPEIPELAHLYGDKLDLFLSVKPGVTSPAKASGRDELSFEQTLNMELDYVERRSISYDLKVLLQTAVSVVRKTNVR